MTEQPTSMRVLIADDYPDAATAIATLLPLLYRGHMEVVVAFDGKEAVRLAKELKPHVAVLDLGMPLMDGVQAAFAFRKALGAAAPCLIAVSGDTDKLMRGEWSDLFDRALCKPLGVEKLAEVFKLGLR
jgi:CheY-like chemotaxis protein